ncbi:MAG: chalcone and stilbene synthase domain protein [Actinomycetia bacterium]|nr:chalcone and stilbene synthase domain protein [Actinomycetes bacterium]
MTAGAASRAVPRVAGIGVSTPPSIDQQELFDSWFEPRWAPDRVGRYLWRRAEVDSRHCVVDPRSEDISHWSTADRMRRYVDEAMPLGKAAIGAALEQSGVAPAAITSFTVVSCTGYATPGIDVLLASSLGLQPRTRRTVLGHMGCHAALPGLAVAADSVTAHGGTSLVLCLELCSLHEQPPDADPQQAVVHALFSDAAGAMVVRDDGPGLEVVEISSTTDWASRDAMTWTVTDFGFRMTLSPDVPRLLAVQVREQVDGLLARHGLQRGDVAHWAVHPGGPRILDVCADELALDDAAMAPSRDTLREHGNCSSATIVLVLDRLLRDDPPPAGAPVVAMAFGPGLTLETALLKA